MNEYIPIVGYEDYLVNVQGSIYSTKVNRELKIHTNAKGYNYVTFCINGKNKNILLHRLIAFMYLNLPSLDSTLDVDHIDRDRKNNSVSNLQVLDKEAHMTKTLSDRGLQRRELKYCHNCGVILSPRNKSGLCKKHLNERISQNISAEDIELLVRKYSWVRAAKEFGLTDNGLRKRYFKLTGKDPKSIKNTRIA